MKKLLLMIVACFAAIAANAGTIYLVGSGTVDGKSLGGSPNGNCLAVTSDNNVYTFKVNNIGWMKFSDTNATDWATFNKNGWTIDGKGDYALSASDLGKTFNLWYSNGNSEGTNNINPPSSGEYTYTLTVGAKGTNQSTLVVTAASDEKITYEIYLRGSWDGYGTSANYKFAQVGDTDDYELTGVTLASGTTFKIADANWGAMNFGGAGKVNANTSYTLTYNGSDMTLNQDINNATVKFNIDTHVMYIEDATADPDVPVTPDYSNVWLHVGGEFNGYDFYNGGINPNDEGIATFSNLAIGTSTFKVHIWTGEEGDVYYIMDDPNGGTVVPTGEWVQYVKDAYDIYDTIEGATSDAVYDIEYNVNTNQLYITLVSGGTVTPPTPTLPETVYLMGDINDFAWATDQGVEATGDEGVYSWTGVTVNDSDNGYGYFNVATVLGSNWDAVNGGDRYGAPVNNTPLGIDAPAAVILYAVNVDASACKSWKVAAGKYDITLNLNDMEVSIAEFVEEEPTPEVPEYGENINAQYSFNDFAKLQALVPSLPNVDAWTQLSGNSYYELPSPTVMNVDGSTVTLTSESTTNKFYYFSSNYDLRIYADNLLTVSVPSGYAIDKISIEGYSTTASTNPVKLEASVGNYEQDSSNKKFCYWTPATVARAAEATNSVEFKSIATSSVRLVGINVEAHEISTGIDSVEVDENAVPVYYNLQGVKVANPENGLYIKVVNGKATKVIVRK